MSDGISKANRNGKLPQKKAKVLYEMLGLPIRLRNDATEKMRQAGIREETRERTAIVFGFCPRSTMRMSVLKSNRLSMPCRKCRS